MRICAGSLHDPERVLDWLTSQDMIDLKNEIEEVSRKMLDKLLQENDFIAIFFCKSLLSFSLSLPYPLLWSKRCLICSLSLFVFCSDDEDCLACDEALRSLEEIDDDIDELDIIFVKICDARYAFRYGVKNLPALTYFRKRFPALYHGKASL